MSVCAEDVVFASTEVSVYLAGEEGVLGNVCISRVLIQREEKQPGDSYEDEGEGDIGWEFEDSAILSQCENGGCYIGHISSCAVISR
jgi:hypothetical protein